MLPHHRPGRSIGRWHLDHDLDPEHRRPVLRSVPTGQRHVQRSQLAALVGDDACSCAAQQESSSDRHRKLCESVLALVLSVLLPDQA